ncbi:GPI-anchored wall transfer protein [Trifolium medium]|uniref:GPI-anchored wall transfer protein n=1 Tax=Trifolium medium TaxID=97028 RepID=A0A392M3X2_9FABA|nr:GPI-anchored wall transfer protein [Trifolium medium]
MWEMMEGAEGDEQEATITMMQVRSENNESTIESEKIEAYSTQVSDYHSDINSAKSDGDLTDSMALNISINTVCSPKALDRNPHEVAKEKQIDCDLTMVPPPPPNSVHPMIAISQCGPSPEPQYSETVVTQPKLSDATLFIMVGGVSVATRVESWKSEMKVERRHPRSSDLQPPSKPPDVEVETDNVELNNLHHGMSRPPSKPPYAGDNSVHVREGIAAKGEEILEKERAKRTFGEDSRSFNLMSQTHDIFCLILEEVAIWAEIKVMGLVQFKDSKGDLKMGVGIVEYTNQKRKDRGSNWSCCKLDPMVNQVGLAQNNSSMWDRGFERLAVTKNLKLVHFFNDMYALNHVAHKQRDLLKEVFVLANSFDDNQVHVSEFGVHQNCFFTFIVISILTSSIHVAPQYLGVFDSLVLVSYQFSLMFELNPYWLADERGMNIMSQNKEIIVDILGYWGVYSVVVGVHEGNHLAFGRQTYVFRSGRIIPLIKRIVALPDWFFSLCGSMLTIFLIIKNHLETLREYLLFLRTENMVVLESIGMVKPLAQGILVESFKYGMVIFDAIVVPCEEVFLSFLLPLFDSLVLSKRNVMYRMSVRAFRQWDPGELNFPMATGTCDCCWNYLIIFCGLFNFIFDRGKF